MRTINNLIFIFAALVIVRNTLSAQCNSSNSPTFQITTTQLTFPMNGVCGALINIINANTNPIPGGPVSFSIFAPGQPSSNPTPPPTPSIITVGGIWTVIVKDNSNNCITSQTVQVNVVAAPNISFVASNTLVCAGYPTTITAFGANSYTWTTVATTPSITVNPTVTSIYGVVGTSTDNCSSTATINISVNPIPNITGTVSPNNVCANELTTITATGANSFTWSTSQISTSITVTPAISTNYTVSGTNEHGCEASKQFIVTVSPCTSIDDFAKADQLKMFPNPADGLVELRIANDNLTADVVIVSIFNRFGQIVRKEEVFGKEKVIINTSDLADDIYFLQIKIGESGTSTKKLIVHH